MKYLFSFLVYLFLSSASFAQDKKFYAEQGVGLNVSYGYAWNHNAELYNLRAHTPSFEIHWFKNTSGAAAWEKSFGKPRYGISLFFIDYGRPRILGKGIGIHPWMDFPLIRKNKGELSLRVTTGIGFITRPWELHANPFNRAIGSQLNGNLGLYLDYYRKVSDRITLLGAVGISHYSNGNFRMPNYGINSPLVSLGVKYAYAKREEEQSFKTFHRKKDVHMQVGLSVGFKESDYIFRHFVVVPGVQVKLMKNISSKNVLTLGLDMAKDKASYFYRVQTLLNPKVPFSEQFEAGLKVGHDLLIARYFITTEMGVYFIQPSSFKGSFFHRFGFGKYLTDDIAFCVALKTHFTQADYFEWGLFYKFRTYRMKKDPSKIEL